MTMRHARIFLLLLTLGALLGAACSSTDGATIETVDPETAAEVIQTEPDAVVLDIRTAEEYNDGIIEGAINIDFYATDFAEQLDTLDKDTHYVVYCRSDNRSGQAMDTFVDLGFTTVTEIDGGIVNWYQTGLPVVRP